MNLGKLLRYVCGAVVTGTMAVAGFGQDAAKQPQKTSTATPGGDMCITSAQWDEVR